MGLSPTPCLEPQPPQQVLGLLPPREPYRGQPLGPDSTQIFKVSLRTLVRSVPLDLGAPSKTKEGLRCGFVGGCLPSTHKIPKCNLIYKGRHKDYLGWMGKDIGNGFTIKFRLSE